MHIIAPLLSRSPKGNAVPFQQLLPIRLRNRLSGKGQKGNDVGCLMEMSVLFACLKKNEFQQNSCSPEITAFQKCYEDDLTIRRQKKMYDKKGILVPGEKNMSFQQINQLLLKYPQ